MCWAKLSRTYRNLVLDDYIDKMVENFFPDDAKKTRSDIVEERKEAKQKRLERRGATAAAVRIGTPAPRLARRMYDEGPQVHVSFLMRRGRSSRTARMLEEALDSTSDEDDWNPIQAPSSINRTLSLSSTSSASSSSSSSSSTSSNSSSSSESARILSEDNNNTDLDDFWSADDDEEGPRVVNETDAETGLESDIESHAIGTSDSEDELDDDDDE